MTAAGTPVKNEPLIAELLEVLLFQQNTTVKTEVHSAKKSR